MGLQYNWSNLSDQDFEAVCRDVMSKMLGDRVESFSAGPDGGIDLRLVNGPKHIIGQSKHYMKSPHSALLKSIKLEKVKMDAIESGPTRYILFTSSPVTPARKHELTEAMSPHIRNSSDVMGLEDIEGWIGEFPEIEDHHYKLWLSSVRVLERIMGNAALTRSKIRVEEIIEKSKFFVPHEKMDVAVKVLQTEHCLIVSGPPGIGKTTMAEMLALKFLEAGYEMHFVAGIDELEERMRLEEKQVFIYDDFLGRTNFKEAPDASSQERLFSFMRYVAKKKHKYFILTTREYLYREAYAANERLAESRADLMRCLLDVSGYDKLKRAKILYNHLYWTSGIDSQVLEKFVREDGYWDIINHDNFNPRWIADTLTRIAAPTMEAEEDFPWT